MLQNRAVSRPCLNRIPRDSRSDGDNVTGCSASRMRGLRTLIKALLAAYCCLQAGLLTQLKNLLHYFFQMVLPDISGQIARICFPGPRNGPIPWPTWPNEIPWPIWILPIPWPIAWPRIWPIPRLPEFPHNR
jgi:hypothetical protein